MTASNPAETGIGFIGLGDQGAPMAAAIAEAGYSLLVWARRPATTDGLAKLGVEPIVCDTVEELGARCDVVGLCVRSDTDVEEVLVDGGLLAAMTPGGVIMNHGTGSPDYAASLEARAHAVGIISLDVPVSGGSVAARERRLTSMGGGDLEVFKRCTPILETFSTTVLHLGPAGSGQLSKLLNNLVLAANLRNAEDALATGAELDMDVDTLVDLLQASSGSSAALHALSKLMTTEQAPHHQALIGKDVEHFVEAARQRSLGESPLVAWGRSGVEGIATAVRRLGR